MRKIIPAEIGERIEGADVTVVQINMMHDGSTGRIMQEIAEEIRLQGISVRTFSPRYYRRFEKHVLPLRPDHTYFGNSAENMLHLRAAQITGLYGLFSVFGTMQLVVKLKREKPDLIHLHNLHNCSVNIPILFQYLKKQSVPVVWTLHDCWAFTGRCAHFSASKCDQWRYGCRTCRHRKSYPGSLLDSAGHMWKKKRKWFTAVQDMMLVTPCRWLEGLTAESFLRDYPRRVILNGIDLESFHPIPSDFRTKNRCTGKYLILAVACSWGFQKGLDVVAELAARLEKELFQIVIVGSITLREKHLPEQVISMGRIDSKRELAQVYTAADVFINPTREDTFPSVNLEALACGTPVITFQTGGSPETIDKSCGFVIPSGDVDGMEKAIRTTVTGKLFSEKMCIHRARQYEHQARYREYGSVYAELLRSRQKQFLIADK